MVYNRVNFVKNWNNKLLCNMFITIRSPFKKYGVDEVYDIRIEDKFYCYAKVLKSETKTLKEIIESGLYFIDTGLNEKDFITLMSNMYSKKAFWKQEQTEMQVIFLEKVLQLTIFDDGKFPIA